MNNAAAVATRLNWVLPLIVFFAILSSVLQPANAVAAGFSDMNRKHWAYVAVSRLTASGVLEGYPDGSFRPDSHVERQEFAAVLARLLAITKPPLPAQAPTFVDVHPQLWSYEYVEAAKPYLPGYHNGDGTMSFRPSAFATRAEIMSALVDFIGFGIISADLGVLTRFSDAAKLSTHLKIYAALAIEENIIAGYDDSTLRLDEPITRAETSAMLVNALAGNKDITLADPPPIQQLYVPDADSGFYDLFYDGGVFVGDSVSMGMRNYVLYQRGRNLPALGSASFLTEVSYNLKVSSREIFSSSGVNLSYGGEKMALPDILSRMGAGKMFIMMGLNDGVANNPAQGIANYSRTLDVVLKKNPGITIYVELCTPVAKKGETARVNNANIDAFNDALKAMCGERGVEWIDTSAPFKDDANCLRSDFTSDNYVHFNNSGSAAWLNALRSFAMDKYVGGEWAPAGVSAESFNGGYTEID
jgi:lysophospholipase L1-like esterase